MEIVSLLFRLFLAVLAMEVVDLLVRLSLAVLAMEIVVAILFRLSLAVAMEIAVSLSSASSTSPAVVPLSSLWKVFAAFALGFSLAVVACIRAFAPNLRSPPPDS